MQLGICKVEIEPVINKKGEFFVLPGNGQALLGIPDTDTLHVLTINCNTIDMQTQNEQMNNKM